MQAYNPYQQMYQPQYQQTQQIQNGGFMSAPNEAFVFNYPVALGNCVTFKIEGQPIVMEKSRGFSQFESPKIDRYRLIKEDSEETIIENPLDGIRDEIKTIWTAIEDLKSVKKNGGNDRNDGKRQRPNEHVSTDES